MKYLKNRKVAIVLALLVCILASLLGMRLSVNRQTAKLETVFMDNNDGSGKGLGQYLKQIDESAYNLIKLGEQVGAPTDALVQAREHYAQAKTYGEYYQAYLELCSAADRLYADLSGKDLTLQQRDMLTKYYTNGINDQKNKLSHMAISFNECVDEYNGIFRTFPMNVFRYLIGVGEAEKFA